MIKLGGVRQRLERRLGMALLTGFVWSSSAHAHMPVRDLQRALSQLPDRGERYLAHAFALGSSTTLAASVPLLLQLSPTAAPPPGALPIVGGWHVLYSKVSAFSQLESVGQLGVATVRYPSLSVAQPHIRGDVARADYGVTGKGAVVGVVDTGISVAHPALRHADGTTRVSWLLRYGQQPRGAHPDLEEEYGCLADDPCAVYDAADINQLLEDGQIDALPQDPIGHGTHVISIAAGRDAAYPGVAPDAQLIFVAAADESGGVYDSRILAGCRFIFDQAQRLASPAVINLSLGSDFGSHRGDSNLELALSELAAGPGRAIVVAAGNSGARYAGIFPEQFAPFGSHAEFAVTKGTELHIPVLQYSTRPREISGAIYVWLGVQPGQEIELAFSTGDGWTEWVAAGDVGAAESESWGDADAFDLAIVNASGQGSYLDLAAGNAVISIAGRFGSDRQFDFAVRGDASLVVWTIGTGQAAYGASSLGPLLPRAQAQGTIQVPATAPDLLAVGATVNRTTWIDYSGDTVAEPGPGTGLALFSSRGPSASGDLKPELVAPGQGIIAAMAEAADPRGNPRSISQFDDGGSCPNDSECYVIDDLHGVASGTSMAAPLATGAIALMMQRDPTLTMQKAKAYLIAGTRALTLDTEVPGTGSGELDVVGALLAQDADASAAMPSTTSPVSPAQSRLTWADDFIRPTPGTGLRGQLIVRDAAGMPRPVAAHDVQLHVAGPGSGTLSPSGPGLFDVHLTAQRGSAEQSLTVSIVALGTELAQEHIAIHLDPVRDEHGYALTGGGCAWRPPLRSGAPVLGLSAIALLLLSRRRRPRLGHHNTLKYT